MRVTPGGREPAESAAIMEDPRRAEHVQHELANVFWGAAPGLAMGASRGRFEGVGPAFTSAPRSTPSLPRTPHQSREQSSPVSAPWTLRVTQSRRLWTPLGDGITHLPRSLFRARVESTVVVCEAITT